MTRIERSSTPLDLGNVVPIRERHLHCLDNLMVYRVTEHGRDPIDGILVGVTSRHVLRVLWPENPELCRHGLVHLEHAILRDAESQFIFGRAA